jgi:hypothetical protein
MVILCNNACWSSSTYWKQFMKIQLKLQLELKIQVQLPYLEFYLVNARDRYGFETFIDSNPDIFSVVL